MNFAKSLVHLCALSCASVCFAVCCLVLSGVAESRLSQMIFSPSLLLLTSYWIHRALMRICRRITKQGIKCLQLQVVFSQKVHYLYGTFAENDM